MAEDTERIAHLHKVIEYERKWHKEDMERAHLRMDELERLARKNHAIRLVEILETVNWEGGPDTLTKAQARGAEHVVQLLRKLASAELDETAGQQPVGK